MKNKKTIVFMPAYNAEKTLEHVVNKIPNKYRKNTVLINDGSTDNTANIAKELKLQVLDHKVNRGYGGAQKTGFKYALKVGADFVIMLHPDGQYDPKELPLFEEALIKNKGDLILGSRFFKQGYKQTPFYKIISIKTITFIYNIVLGTKMTEANTGYRGFNRKLIETIPFQKNESRGYPFDPQLIIQTVHFGFKISDVPSNKSYSPEATSPDFIKSLKHGIECLILLGQYILHKFTIKKYSFLSK